MIGKSTECLSCTYCAQLHPRRKPKDLAERHPCVAFMPSAQDPRNPEEYRWEKRPFRLKTILRAITPKGVWKRFLKPRGYRKETHYRPRLSQTPYRSKRLSVSYPPWKKVREGIEPAAELHTLPPRITTIAFHGPQNLLRPFFPKLPEIPEGALTITDERATRLVQDERSLRLAGTRNLALGGHGTTIPELESLKSPEVSDDLRETEPLRAMALQEVTNIPFLKAYTESLEPEEPEDG